MTIELDRYIELLLREDLSYEEKKEKVELKSQIESKLAQAENSLVFTDKEWALDQLQKMKQELSQLRPIVQALRNQIDYIKRTKPSELQRITVHDLESILATNEDKK